MVQLSGEQHISIQEHGRSPDPSASEGTTDRGGDAAAPAQGRGKSGGRSPATQPLAAIGEDGHRLVWGEHLA